jgi:hypothetical protein
MTVANPSFADALLFREAFRYASEAWNWDLRLKSLQGFVAIARPHCHENFEMFLSSIDSILLNDVESYHSVVLTCFEELFQAELPEQFVTRLLPKVARFTRVDWSPAYRQFGHSLLNIIQKRSPISTGEQFLLFSDEILSYELEDLIRYRKACERTQCGTATTLQSLITTLSETTFAKWRIESEMIQIISVIVKSSPIPPVLVESAAELIFNRILISRKPGFLRSAAIALEPLLVITPALSARFTEHLIDECATFDMTGMRRSAGLPFLALALVHSQSDALPRIAVFLSSLSSSHPTLAANGLNILRNLLLDSESTLAVEPFLPAFLQAIFDCVLQFDKWDVISAANLAFVAFIRKVLKAFDSPNCMNLLQFFGTVPSARGVLLSALSSPNVYAKYLALLLLEQFHEDRADEELCAAVLACIPCRVSRVRRIAVRAAVAIIPPANCESVARETGGSANARHGRELLRRAFGLPPRDIVPQFDWAVRKPPSVAELQLLLLSDALPGLNRARSLDGLRYLASQATSIPAQFSRTVVSQIQSIDSMPLKALLIELLPKIEKCDLGPLLDTFFSMASDFSDEVVPVHLAISALAPHLSAFPQAAKTLFLLSLSDIPAVRRNVAHSFPDFPSDFRVIERLRARLSPSDCATVRSVWLSLLRSRMATDRWGEPLTHFIGELFVLEPIEGAFPTLAAARESVCRVP